MTTGKAHVYGDNIDTDRIIPGKYTKTLDLSSLASHALEDLDPDFRKNVQVGDVLVAGTNFGAGSSREQAPLAIKAVGVSVVIARSYARIFFRNAINIGLPVVEVKDHDIENGHTVTVDFDAGTMTNHDTGKTFAVTRIPQVMMDIVSEGGLVNYLLKYGDYQVK